MQFTIFHLRSLESLEGQPVTTQDRQEAFERFSLGKVTFKKTKFGWGRNLCSEVIQKNILKYELYNAIKIFLENNPINKLT